MACIQDNFPPSGYYARKHHRLLFLCVNPSLTKWWASRFPNEHAEALAELGKIKILPGFVLTIAEIRAWNRKGAAANKKGITLQKFLARGGLIRTIRTVDLEEEERRLKMLPCRL